MFYEIYIYIFIYIFNSDTYNMYLQKVKNQTYFNAIMYIILLINRVITGKNNLKYVFEQSHERTSVHKIYTF